MSEARTRKGRSRREGRTAVVSAPYIRRRIPTYDLLDEEALTVIEENADTVLQETGVEFMEDTEVLEIFRQAGADVKGSRVRFERGMLRKIIQDSAPAEFTLHARNPEKSVIIGGRNTVFAPIYGAPFVHDLDNGRRYATIEDFRNLVKLVYQLPYLHMSGGTVCEPTDIPVSKRHLDMVYSHIRYSDKPFMGSVTEGSRAEDSIHMAKILFGDGFVEENCCLVNIINVNSPLTYDSTMLASLKVYAAHGQGTIITPFILSGAMGPVSTAGTLTQMLAEALPGIALTQLIRPGAPVILGNFTSSMSMRSGAPTFGMPEPALALLAAGQLARRLGVPWRGGGSLTASKLPDAQALQESSDTLFPAMLGGVNLMMQSAGWLEGGLSVGLEKLILDADHLGMMARLADGMDMSGNGQAMDAIREVGPGKHYLGCAHTQANFKTAFYDPVINDSNSFEQWQQDGSLDAARRANTIWKRMLDEYQAPFLDPEIDEALNAFMAERRQELPDSFV